MASQWRRWAWCVALIAGAPASVGLCDPAPVISSAIPPMDLTIPFNTRSPWRLVVTEGPPTEDYGGNPAPGALDICFQKGSAAPCGRKPAPSDPSSVDWDAHYLNLAKPVYPRGESRPPLLQLVTASLHAGDGGQLVVTKLLKYDRARDAFKPVYVHSTGTNHNEEVRFIADGPLKGSVISAEPTSNAPYGYWITVSRFTPAQTYRQVLRYRSATRYNDGNALAVIDSEMPNLEQRLGLWRPGSPLPLPPGAVKPCLKPTLKNMELWRQCPARPTAK